MILVTGATGAVGAATVKALQSTGAAFKVAVRSPEKAKALGAEGVAFDWDKPETFIPAFQGVKKIFLLTPVTQFQVGHTLDVVAAARRTGVQHLVKLSVVGADAEPGIALGRQHFAAERELKASGIAWTFLRPTFFMQNFVNYYGVNPKQDGPVYLPHGTSKASWVDVQDIGEVGAKVLTAPGHEGKVYDLTGGEALSSAEALAILGEALGRKYTYVDAPEEAARKAMEDAQSPLWMVDGFAELNFLIKAGYAAGLADGVKQVLGREPRTFRQYAQDFAASLK